MNITHINKFNLKSNLNTLHSATRIDSGASGASNEQQAVSVSYQSIESYYNHLMYAAMQQGSIFEAMKLLNEAEQLNEGKGLTDYHYAQIKFHFMQKDRDNTKNKSQKDKANSYPFLKKENDKRQSKFEEIGFIDNEISKIKSSDRQREDYISQIELQNKKKSKIKNDLLHRKMVKGYMEMLSNQSGMSKIEYRI